MFCLQRVDFCSLEFEVRMVISQQKVQFITFLSTGLEKQGVFSGRTFNLAETLTNSFFCKRK